MVVTATKGIVGTDSFEEVALGLQTIPNYTEYALANTLTEMWGAVSSQFYNSIENDFFLFGAMLYEEVVDGHTISTVALLGSNDECDALENTYKHTFSAVTSADGALAFDGEPIVEEIYTNSCKLSYSRTDNPFPKEMITILSEPTGGDPKLDSRIIFSFDNQ